MLYILVIFQFVDVSSHLAIEAYIIAFSCSICILFLFYCFQKYAIMIMEVQSNLRNFVILIITVKVSFLFQQNDTKLNIFEEKTTCSKSDKNRYIVEQLR